MQLFNCITYYFPGMSEVMGIEVRLLFQSFNMKNSVLLKKKKQKNKKALLGTYQPPGQSNHIVSDHRTYSSCDLIWRHQLSQCTWRRELVRSDTLWWVTQRGGSSYFCCLIFIPQQLLYQLNKPDLGQGGAEPPGMVSCVSGTRLCPHPRFCYLRSLTPCADSQAVTTVRPPQRHLPLTQEDVT